MQPRLGAFFASGGHAPRSPPVVSEPTLGQWAATIRKAAAGGAPNVTLLAGNEPSDADSIVTAQLYGYLKHCRQSRETSQWFRW